MGWELGNLLLWVSKMRIESIQLDLVVVYYCSLSKQIGQLYMYMSYLDRRYCLVHHLVLICCFKSLVHDTSSQKYKVLVFCYKMNGVLELYCLCTVDYEANDNRHLLALLDFPGSTPSIRQSVPFISNNPQLLEIIRSHGTCILFLKFSFAMSIGSINYKSLTRLSTWHSLCLH